MKQILPLLKCVIASCINTSDKQVTEPVQSWSLLALLDSLTCLDGLLGYIPRELIVKELIEVLNVSCVSVKFYLLTILINCLFISHLAGWKLPACQRSYAVSFRHCLAPGG